MRNPVITLLLLAGLVIAGTTASAEDEASTKERKTQLKSSGTVTSMRPGAPSRQSVECTLSDAGIMVITMRVPEGEAELTVTDGFDTITEWFDTSAPYTTILPDGTATYSVSVTTAQGHTYSGTI